MRALDESGRGPPLRHDHVFDATLGELHGRAGDPSSGDEHFKPARDQFFV
jgi:hypothetical protein